MSKYEDMSDFEINLLVYCVTKNKNPVGAYKTSGWFEIAVLDKGEYYSHEDIANYCGDPSSIMPIAIEHKLKIEWLDDDEGDYCNVQSPCGSVFSDDENPYRAMSICFLKMKEAEVK